MPQPKPKKIVYLFGAGATHAELSVLENTILEEKEGLLMKSVSARVIDQARRKKNYVKGIEMVSSTKGSLNIELLISLIENSKVEGWEFKSQILKTLVKKDIQTILNKKSRIKKFYLHKALFELHKKKIVRSKEKLIGIISLNYDDVLDRAYKEYYGEPNYCFSLEKDTSVANKIPLLKLHGSFNWNKKKIRGRKRTIEIIPLGASKNYLHAPYNFIWSRAMEILIECDTLRVIGCSLSQNDIHLIDLLFKAHVEKGHPFLIEIISSTETGEGIQKNYGIFPEIKTLTEIGSPKAGYKNEVPLVGGDPNPNNAFHTWIKYKVDSMLKKKVKKTKYVKLLTQ